jgi:hypothetical protein
MSELPGIAFVPNTGDDVRWESIGYEHQFYVEGRMFRFSAEGGVQIVFCIEVRPT